jgi:hypothetical protein
MINKERKRRMEELYRKMEKSSLLKKKRERGNQLEQIMVTERGM